MQKYLTELISDMQSSCVCSRSTSAQTNVLAFSRWCSNMFLLLPTPKTSYSFPVCMCVFIDGRSPVVNSFSPFSLPLAAPLISGIFSYSQSCGSGSFGKKAFISEAPLRMLKFVNIWALHCINQMEDILYKGLCWRDPVSISERSISEMGVVQRSIKKKC